MSLVVVVLGPGPVGLVVLVGVVAVGAYHRRRSAAASRRATELSTTVVEAIGEFAADLAAGHPPLAALGALAEEHLRPPTTPARQQLGRELRRVEESGRLGAAVPPALRRVGQVRGAEGLHALAAAWQVAERTGAALGPVLAQVSDGLRDQQVAERSVRAALSGARATARLLASLPLVGLLLGTSLGLAPAEFLLGTTPGRVCLVAGLGLEALGLTWTDRMAEAAARPVPR
ncbi:MAG TPA: type II secretion system F family protein [Candidatus Limnocylindria bacterium]|nr:type II secretion system F family protein [Candidatus Limnocylindria bacterium]